MEYTGSRPIATFLKTKDTAKRILWFMADSVQDSKQVGVQVRKHIIGVVKRGIEKNVRFVRRNRSP